MAKDDTGDYWKHKGSPDKEYGLQITWTNGNSARHWYKNEAIRNTTFGRMRNSKKVSKVVKIERFKKD